jgi:hypothetical protein
LTRSRIETWLQGSWNPWWPADKCLRLSWYQMPPVDTWDLYEVATGDCKWPIPHWRRMSNMSDDGTCHITDTGSPICQAWLAFRFQPNKDLGAWPEVLQR